MRHFITVAIDGTAASGKTSTALKIAQKYNMLMASTGLYYRAITLHLLRSGVESGDVDAAVDCIEQISLGTEISGNISQLTINGDIFDEHSLRTGDVNEAVAVYSSIGEIRDFLFDYQRSQVDIARHNGFSGLVMEGRDITSVILPDADLRFFLDASVGERSLRRKNDSEEDYISARDKIDNRRAICGDGVMKIDTGANDLNAVVAEISSKIDALLEESARKSH
ncbi:MAG: (d)CMP kinase [Puniceicoccales bacterium]|jgi:cytidylate kinase|nr:(d)CMP kinase [Puniceicoccales bacterium]